MKYDIKRILQVVFAFVLALYLVCVSWLFKGCVSKKNKGPSEFTETAVETEKPEKKIDNEKISKDLEKEINSIISEKKGVWSVYVKNLKTGMTVEINNREFIAASTIKLYNMVTLYDEVEKGNINLNSSMKNHLSKMITESSNVSSNTVVITIGQGSFGEGAKKVTGFATDLGCKNTYEQHMLYEDYIPPNGKNRTSVADCGLILEKIYLKECVSPEYDEEMLELLKQQTIRTKIPANLPEDIVVANKTGENSSVEADVGIVFSPECDYIICISVEKYGERKPIGTIAEVSECVYNFFNEPETEE